MSRRLPFLTLVTLAVAGNPAPAQPGYAYRNQSAEPPLADDPKAQEKLLALAHQQRPYVPSVRPMETPAPGVVLRVQAPAASPTGQDVDVRIVVENHSYVPAKNVTVICTLPPQSTVVKSEPPEQPPGSATWKFDALAAGGQREILLTVKPPSDVAEFETKARVVVEQEQSAKTRFAKAEVKLTKVGPKQALRFDILVMQLTVTNPTDVELRDVLVNEKLPPGLVHRTDEENDRQVTPGPTKVTTAVSDDGQTRTWTIDRLGPHEARRIEYHVNAATAPAGVVEHQAFVRAAGGVQDTASDKVELIEPKLEIKVDAPPRKAANVPASVRITLTNGGARALQNIVITDVIDQGTVGRVGPAGQKLQDRLVQWIVPALGPNQTRVLELEVSKPDGGVVHHKVSAVYRGLNLTAEAGTDFDASAVLSYDLRGNTPTVEVGGEVTYELTVRNSGSAPAANIRPVIELPAELSFVSAEPDTKADGGKVSFEPIQKLGPNDRATFRVKAKAVTTSLGARVTAELSGDPFPTGPVRRQEMIAIGAGAPKPASDPRAGTPTPPASVPLPVPVPPPK
jgi:uncharacterized repeat protein (TIGR01451 family)